MNTRVARLFAMPALALSLSLATAGNAHADENTLSSAVWELVAMPLMKVVQAVEERVTTLESTITAFAASFTTQRLEAHKLCISDDSGAQTCISKAQLDALLRAASVAAEPEAAKSVPAVIVPAEADHAKEEEPAETGTTVPAAEPATGKAEEKTEGILVDPDKPTDLKPTDLAEKAVSGAALVQLVEVEIYTPPHPDPAN
jgi:hypothetical protein